MEDRSSGTDARTKGRTDVRRLLTRYFGPGEVWRSETDDLRIAIRLVEALRPPERGKAARNTPTILPLLEALRSTPAFRTGLREYVLSILRDRSIRSGLTDHGILADAQFRGEVLRRLSYKFLPYQPDQRTVAYVLMNVFYRSSDVDWVRALPLAELEELFTLLDLRPVHDDARSTGHFAQLVVAVEVLAHRICGRALEEDVMKMVPEQAGFTNPFIAFQRELDRFVEHFMAGDELRPTTRTTEDQRHLLVLLEQCSDYVDRAFRNSARFGISIRVNQNLLRIRQQIDRIGEVVRLMLTDEQRTPTTNTIQLARNLIIYNGEKTDVKQLLDQSTRLLAYEITQHTGRTGEHYITGNAQGYRRMFLSAAGGGVIVAFMCIVKVQLGLVHAPLFVKALLSSANYALGFTLIYLSGATLATKQPAMTAATLVKSLKDAVSGHTTYGEFADLFARVFRSQFIAFVGNVLLAFPVALAVCFGIVQAWDYLVAAGRWPVLVQDLHPWRSLAMPHAAIAGVFLFFSGIIAGSVANRGLHERIPLRIAEHPLLKRMIGPRRTARLARFYSQRWAGIVSNMIFGLCMGSTYYMGQFFGLPLDIRHITFAAGNLGIALNAAELHLATTTVLVSVAGIFLIGLVNFLVSFTLSLTLAMRSRSIPLSDLDDIVKAIWTHFKHRPATFFFPPRGAGLVNASEARPAQAQQPAPTEQP